MSQRGFWRRRPMVLLGIASVCLLCVAPVSVKGMPEERRLQLRDAAKEMFYHGWDSYMKYAFPKDELNPILCNGRGSDKKNPSNINVNDALGDYSLTLVDTLDTLAIMGDQAGFEHAVRLTIANVDFNLNSKVQVFEANIRMLGGLLSAHLLATDPKLGYFIEDYDGELLSLAQDLAKRLIPAFQLSRTGIPYPRVNLRHGVPKTETVETCSAGAGSLILEFGVLSRLTNNSIYETAAKGALRAIWNRRSELGLIGNVINLQTGQWIHTASSTGAGIDSIFEYMLKAYVLFGEHEYLSMFREAYGAIMKYIRDPTGYLYRNVHMANGGLMSSWVDSLSAYFPGLQVLAGDLDSAIKSHLLYYNIWRKYQSLPERFDFYLRNVNIGSYPLRPEFVESTYFLYRATRDPFYLRVGEMILEDLNKHTRVACGFASVGDIVSRRLEDRMESFALSETFKYLYLLFDLDHSLNRVDSNFVFTTEGHILPLPGQYLHTNRHRPDPYYSSDDGSFNEISVFLRSDICPVYNPEQYHSQHSQFRRSPQQPKSQSGRSTKMGLTPLTANYHRTYLPSSRTTSHYANSAILSRPDADFARELVGLDDAYIPVLDPHGYCEAPNLFPQTIELTFGYPAGSHNNQHNANSREGDAATDMDDLGWSPTIYKVLGGLVASTLAGIKVELTKRSTRQGGGLDVTKVGDFRLYPGEMLKVNSDAMQMYLTHPPSEEGPEMNNPTPFGDQQENKIPSKERALLRVFTRNTGEHQDYKVATSQFGPRISNPAHSSTSIVSGPLYHFPFASSLSLGCDSYTTERATLVAGRILVIRRGACIFTRKVRLAQAAGARGVIFVNTENILIWPQPGEDDFDDTVISIPSALVTWETGKELVRKLEAWEREVCVPGLPREEDSWVGLMAALVPDPEAQIKVVEAEQVNLEEVEVEERATPRKGTMKLSLNGHVIHNIELVD